MDRQTIIVGAGAAGMTAALTAAEHGTPVAVVEVADQVGGSLNLSSGQLSAAGTVLQARHGIQDTPDAHFADVMRISDGTADPKLVRLAVNNAAETLDWLLERGMEFLPEHPVAGHEHEPYTTPRYCWGPEFGRSILAVLRREFDRHVQSGLIDLRLNTELTDLVLSSDGKAVTGVRTRPADRPARIGPQTNLAATTVLLATGGYNANYALFEELNSKPAYGGNSWPYNKGGGLLAARRAGAVVRGGENYLSSFGVVMDRTELGAKVFCRPIHHPQVRQPWEIYVNTEGRRFVAEDNPSVNAREHALLNQPHLRRFMIFDARVLRESPPMMADMTNAELLDLFDAHPMFASGASPAELAHRAGIDAGNLVDTLRLYNAGLGDQDPFGRVHRPRPLVEAPFYAIRVQGSSVTSTVGLTVDEEFRVRDAVGEPINGLYAVGELLGSAQLMGKSFCGGMMATPALTFGMMFGRSLARSMQIGRG
jgi:fumarate reductase flavoprotein subunit